MLEKLIVRNYKSLHSVEVPLRPLTVFVGPNASGKSTLLDSLTFLSNLVGRGTELAGAFEARHGYTSVVWGGDPKARISLAMTGQLPAETNDLHFEYAGDFSGEDGGRVVDEKIRLPDGRLLQRGEQNSIRVKAGNASSTWEPSRKYSMLTDFPWPAQFPDVHRLSKFIASWAFYRFSPAAMKEPRPVQEQTLLDSHGDNLNTVLHYLFSERGDTFREVEELLRAFLPEVVELRSRLSGHLTYAAFTEKSLARPIATWQMSDGSLFCLALAVALLTPEPPGLIAIEAPDTELHPYVMEQVAEALKEAATKTQVLVTTHSPFLLRYLPPESLVIVEKKDGKTFCTPVEGRAGALEAVQLLGVDKAFLSGHLGGVP